MRQESFSIIEVGLTEVAGEPRCRDIDLGERLGLSEPINIRKLIQRHRAELEAFGVISTVEITSGNRGGRPGLEFWLSEEQALLVAAVSAAPKAPAVRAMLIKVFVAWRRGRLPPPDGVVTQIDAEARKVLGGIVKSIVHSEIANMIPAMVEAEMAKTQLTVVQGITAGEVIELAGITDRKGTKGLAGAVSRMLFRYHAVKAVPIKLARLGMRSAYAFDPALCKAWLDDHGKETILRRVQDKRGQGRLHLIGKMPKAPEAPAT